MSYTYTSEGIIVDGELLTLDTITESILKEKVKKQNLVLMTIEWNGGRAFDGIKEQIVLKYDNAIKLKDIIVGLEVYFGEIAGKHSDIYGTIEEDEITIGGDVVKFLQKAPEGHSYDYSFLHTISEYMDEYIEQETVTCTLEQYHSLWEI